MKTKKHSPMENLKIFSGLTLLTLCLIAFVSCNESQSASGTEETIAPPPPPPDAPPPPPDFTLEKGDTVWIKVDAMPEFPGGEAEILNFIVKNTIYPALAKENGIEGKVIVSFIVNKDGTSGSARIVKSVAPDIDAEALRVINSLPSFEKPAIKNGEPVPVWFMVPITFALK